MKYSWPRIVPALIPVIFGLGFVGLEPIAARPIAQYQQYQQIIRGFASYRERIALPADARFEAVLQEISPFSNQTREISQVSIESIGQIPIRFRLRFDRSQIKRNRQYVIIGRIYSGNSLLFSNEQTYQVLSSSLLNSDSLNNVDLQLRRVRGNQTYAQPLTNIYWKLVELNNRPIIISDRRREPHLILRIDNQVTGFSGCNTLVGTYALRANRLTFGQLAGTLTTCASSRYSEEEFTAALAKTATWQIIDQQLELIDRFGNVLARFEARQL